MRIELPFPPSVNTMFVNVTGKGRVKSAEYKSWTRAALWELKAQKAKPVSGEVSISIGLVAPSRQPMDCDNRIKPILDALTAGGILKQDDNRYVRRVSAEWVADGAPCTVIVQQYEGSAS